MMPLLPYRIGEPPARLKKAKLDNIALVPASLLPLKVTYQPLANRLPTGSILCVPGTPRQQKIIAKVTQFFKDHGHLCFTLPIERLTKRATNTSPRAGAKSVQLAF